MKNRVSRRDFLKAGTAGLCAWTLGARGGTGEVGKRPNVLIITTDQQCVTAMSAMGNGWVKTPNMDALAANGVCFANSYCSYPLCSPSRATLHTSRMPHETGINHNALPIAPEIPLSGQVFREAGYDTAYVGKWHLPVSYPNDGIAGFEVLNTVERNNKLAHDVDEATLAGAVEFLRRKHDKPFFLVASFINPHDICQLAGADKKDKLQDELRTRYYPAAGASWPPLPANFGRPQGEPDLMARKLRCEEWNEGDWRAYRYAYYRLLEDVDRQVGGVMEALRQTGQEDNTLVVFTSDHGEGQGAHHRAGKMMFYEEEAAVPLIVSWKGVTPAGRIDRTHLVSTVDVLPTLCDYAGVKPPELVRGQSLRPMLEKPESAGHGFVVSEMVVGENPGASRSFMVRTKKYKYMVFPGTEQNEMLFDLETDPGEMKNLVGSADLSDELLRHRALLAEWRAATAEEAGPIKSKKDGPRPKKKKKKA